MFAAEDTRCPPAAWPCNGRVELPHSLLAPSSPGYRAPAGQGPHRHAANTPGAPSPAICHTATLPGSRGSLGRAQPILPDRSEQELRLLWRARLGPGPSLAPCVQQPGGGVPEGASIAALWLSGEQGLLVGALALSHLSCSTYARSGYPPYPCTYTPVQLLSPQLPFPLAFTRPCSHPAILSTLQLWALPHRFSGLRLVPVFVVGDSAPVSSAKLISELDPTRLLVLHILPAYSGPGLHQPQLTWEVMRVGNTLWLLPSFPSCCGFALCPRLKG